MKSKNRREGVWCFMLGIVFLAALLGAVMVRPETNESTWVEGMKKGVSNCVELVKSKAENIKERLMPENGRRHPPVLEVKAADPAKASEILNSVGSAAGIFSIRVGGGGDSLFPQTAFQMKDDMPPVVAKSIEGCFSAPVVPMGGYVCQYVVDPARTNFLCKAIPAEGYTGAVFIVQKDMTIRQDHYITGILTNSSFQKSN